MPHVLLQVLSRSEKNSLLNVTEMQQLGGLWPILQMLSISLIYTFTFTEH